MDSHEEVVKVLEGFVQFRHHFTAPTLLSFSLAVSTWTGLEILS